MGASKTLATDLDQNWAIYLLWMYLVLGLMRINHKFTQRSAASCLDRWETLMPTPKLQGLVTTNQTALESSLKILTGPFPKVQEMICQNQLSLAQAPMSMIKTIRVWWLPIKVITLVATKDLDKKTVKFPAQVLTMETIWNQISQLEWEANCKLLVDWMCLALA